MSNAQSTRHAAEPRDLADAPVLTARGLRKFFPVRRGLLRRAAAWVRAVDGVDFDIRRARTLGLVGESGCGKTTLGRLALRLLDADEGSVSFRGVDLTSLKPRALRRCRRGMQIVFQDPVASLNPRMRVGTAVGEGLRIWTDLGGAGRRQRVEELLRTVGLPAEAAARYPHEFSGGQRQRIGIARALATDPEVVVCDEPVSALDVSVQAQIINLLIDLQERLGVSYMFISHDLSVVRHVSHEVAVMYLGQVVESAAASTLFANPVHPYTRLLLSAMPVPDPGAGKRQLTAVDVADAETCGSVGNVCRFYPRCPERGEDCRCTIPLREAETGHFVRCVRCG